MTRWVRWVPRSRRAPRPGSIRDRLTARRSPQNAPELGIMLPVQSIRWLPEELEPLPISTEVTLGFRDGTTATVSPDSAEGAAFRTVAAVLVQKDGR